jgi:predicted HD phosphohydrolase
MLHAAPKKITKEAVKKAAVHRIVGLFNHFGAEEYIGEAIDIATHGLQTAFAAKCAGEDEEVQLAGLFHDVGHLLALEAGQDMEMEDENGMGTGTMNHDIIGADFLARLGFSDNISFVARRHVDAKRYLCAREPGYYDALSPASKTTLSYQNGPMSEEECLEFEGSPSYEFAARVRKFDDRAKEVGRDIPGLSAYMPLIEQHIDAAFDGHSEISPYAHSYVLSAPQLHQWEKNGMLLIPNALNEETINNLSDWSNEVAHWAKDDQVGNNVGTAGPWLRHFEVIGGNEDNLQLARVENFSKRHDGLGNLTFGVVNDLVSQVYGTDALLFKDKLNFKMPGGAGFLCHQDATAYSTGNLASHHVSAMVAIDKATKENGCLEVAPGLHKQGILKNNEGVTDGQLEKEFEFIDILTNPGDVVLFDSYLPHRSGPNRSDKPRQLAYLTYNAATEGDFHQEYYAMKLKNMDNGQMSINNDFAGVLV